MSANNAINYRTEADPLFYDPDDQYYDTETDELFQWVGPDQAKNPEDAQTMEMFTQAGENYYLPDKEEGEVEQALRKDAYSLLYTADFCSRTFIIAMLVIILLQAMILIVLFADLYDFNSTPIKTNDVTNRMKLPAGAEPTVTMAQFLGIIVIVFVLAAKGDVVTGMGHLLEGYDEDIRYDMPNATCFRWFSTATLQFLNGAILVADSFALTMQATSVIEIVISLTALYFIQQFEKLAFSLASLGILSDPVRQDCNRAQTLQQVSPPEFVRRVRISKCGILILLMISLLIPYSIMVHWQKSGKFLCMKVYIQFGDAFVPELAYYSGDFTSQGNKPKQGRFVYTDQSKTLQLAFCGAEQVWTVSRVDSNNTCAYIYKSSVTDTFDIMEVAEMPWSVKTNVTGDVPVDWMKVVCNDCNSERCNPGQGKCVDNQCVCKPGAGRLGFNCELEDNCLSYGIDSRTRESLASTPGASIFLQNQFVAWTDKDTTLYNRYFYLPKNKRSNETDLFMIFSGRRWVIFCFSPETPPKPSQEITAYLSKSNPGNNSLQFLSNIEKAKLFKGFSPLFFSSPVNYGSKSYGATPAEVTWVQAKKKSRSGVLSHSPDDDQPIAARLICTNCGSNDDCLNEGYCEEGRCLCPDAYEGFQCERAIDCVQAGGCKNSGICQDKTKICDCQTV